ncbi:hypothetical protein HY967_01070 [Candidatus Jorgensenbacteria bacterium]|nr:hypothetical protein [Candidatus Jorgensenbacteria bacterium]
MNRTGFTLIETVIYSALLAVFIVGAFLFLNSILDGSVRTLERNEVVANQEFVEQKLRWILSGAKSVSVPSTGSSSSTLTLEGNATSTYPASFSFASSAIRLSLASGTPVFLTNDRVSVISFLAEHFSSSQASSSIVVSFAISSANIPAVRTSSTNSYILP